MCSIYWDISIQFKVFCLHYLRHSHFLFCFKHFSHKIAAEVILLLDAFRTKKVSLLYFIWFRIREIGILFWI